MEGACLVCVLLLTALVLADLRNPPDLLLFVGRFHPMIVHFPIGLILLAGMLELLGTFRRFRALRYASTFVLTLGAAGAVGAVVAGYLLSLQGGYDEGLIDSHRWLGVGVAVGAMASLVLKLRSHRNPSRLLRRSYGAVLAATVGSLMLAGHQGGSLTHGSGYLTYYMPEPLKRLVRVEPTLARSLITDIDSAVVYRDLVAPVLHARCISCHTASKAQGGLRLDTPDGVLHGGDGGPVLRAGNAVASELFRRVTLHPDHEDVMPPNGARPLSVGETELIRWWIENGASFEVRVAEIEEVPSSVATHFTRVAPPRGEKRSAVYAFEVAPADPGALERLRSSGYQVGPIAADLRLLHFSPGAGRSRFGDAELERLRAVAPQISWLDLNRTRVTDAGLEILAEMPHLTRLRLDDTAITDAGLEHIRRLANLEYVNLHGTRVSDTGLAFLEGLPRLRSLYLWRTQVTAAGAEELHRSHPRLELVLGNPAGDE